MNDQVLKIDKLSITFDTPRGPLQAVHDMSLSVAKGESVALVGESGCGKSVTALSILRLLGYFNAPKKFSLSGSVEFCDTDGKVRSLLDIDDNDLHSIRGNRISMIFQEPMTCLNPVLQIGEQVAEVLRRHRGISEKQAMKLATSLLSRVGIPDAKHRIKGYPHQLSGGMRQRVMIAGAIACEPALLLADEPTTALDVTVQAQILSLLQDLQRSMGMSVLFITHNLGIVAQFCTKVCVMYAGYSVESGPTAQLFQRPAHPYTRLLLGAIPRIRRGSTARKELITIPGTVPNPISPPAGCPFHPRCPYAIDICGHEMPYAVQFGEGRSVRCHRWENQYEETAP